MPVIKALLNTTVTHLCLPLAKEVLNLVHFELSLIKIREGKFGNKLWRET